MFFQVGKDISRISHQQQTQLQDPSGTQKGQGGLSGHPSGLVNQGNIQHDLLYICSIYINIYTYIIYIFICIHTYIIYTHIFILSFIELEAVFFQ